MAEESVARGLMDFGLTSIEAKAYMLLLRAAPCPARIVAQSLNVNRMRAYRVLSALVEKGLAEAIIGRPVKYIAVPLKEALNKKLEEAKMKALSLEKRAKEILDNWSMIYRTSVKIEEPRFRILQGRQQAYELLLQMCERVEREVSIITTVNDLNRLSFADVEKRLKDLNHKGVKIQVLTRIDPSGMAVVKEYLGFAEVHSIILPARIRVVTIDESEAFTTFAMDDSMSMTTREDVGLWTNASGYVKATKCFFDALWVNSAPAQEVLQNLEAQEAFKEGLKLVKSELETLGLIVEVPGKLVGESGLIHSFNLVAKHPKRLDKLLVLNGSFKGEPPNSLISLYAKALDVKPLIKLLVSTRPIDIKAIELAEKYDINFIHISEAAELPKKIVGEAVRILR